MIELYPVKIILNLDKTMILNFQKIWIWSATVRSLGLPRRPYWPLQADIIAKRGFKLEGVINRHFFIFLVNGILWQVESAEPWSNHVITQLSKWIPFRKISSRKIDSFLKLWQFFDNESSLTWSFNLKNILELSKYILDQ